MPLAGEGTSVSTLSVLTSTNGSNSCTESLTCLSHLVTVPSTTDSPNWGMMTSIAMCCSISLVSAHPLGALMS